MVEKFHERFDIEVSLDEAKRRFVNRVDNLIFSELLSEALSSNTRVSFKRKIVAALGETYESRSISNYVSGDFYKTLHALEAFYDAFFSPGPYLVDNYELLARRECKTLLEEYIVRFLVGAEVDLGVRWENGCFVKTGAVLLDKSLVNDVLHWLRDKSYEDVLTPYEKGLRHFLEVEKRPEVLPDVITDMYEALEALAKIITNRPNSDLSANTELFIKAVKASDAYKNMLKEYIDYANRFRHSPRPARPRPSLSIPEVESFIYLTGIFIRLAITGTDTAAVV
jgi:hypothetical protein